MMITESEMYWLTRLDYFHKAAVVLGAATVFLYIAAMFIGGCIWSDNSNKRPFCCIFPAFLIPIILLVGSCFIPTTEEMCAIKLVPMIANNENVQQLPDKAVDLANNWLDELRPENILKDTDNE